ncbi:TATA element modulatory factor 1 TATA binding domain-containing protein [Rhizoctonia solani AG-1 IA]|uniref:TATA element modulatory factor 1 TATA binding domain-containing protein n=1 Tax=Thanatephorus cucumeris (strain AG1-IA) TaxID=983506 RepID=L8WN52_THACA|nr:TATA element modulatory factor 1 TATA binding domain-containing protein [Rhizoctonia solani AG-1 IA]
MEEEPAVIRCVLSEVSFGAGSSNKPSYLRKNELQTHLSSLDAELASIDAEIQALQQARQNIVKEKEALQRELATTRAPNRTVKVSTSAKTAGTTNYDEGCIRDQGI